MIEQKRKILIILPSYSVKWGGPARVVHDICAGLSSSFNFCILTTSNNESDEILPVPVGVDYVSFTTQKPISNLWKSYSLELDNWLEEHINRFDLLHIHEMWHYSQFAATRKAIKYGIPYLVSPHGELDKWRINHKQWRKRIFGLIFQKKMLMNASVVHALTSFEQESIYEFAGNKTNVTIIPNSISDAPHLNGHSAVHPKKYVLFLGRIQKVKGCLELLKAYTLWEGKIDYDLVFAGPFEEEKYAMKLTDWVADNNLSEKVHFVGLISGSIKQAFLHQASIFVLSSFSEGFPVSVLEAMRAGCPVIVSPFTGIHDLLEENKAAIICQPEPNSITEALDKFFLSSPEALKEMSENAKSLFNQYFSMDRVMQHYGEVYHSLVGKVIPA